MAPCFNYPVIRRMPLNLRNRSIGLRSRQGRGTDNSLPRSTLKERKRSRGYLMSFLPFRCALFGLLFGTSIFRADGREVGQEEMQTKEKKFGNCRLLAEPCVWPLTTCHWRRSLVPLLFLCFDPFLPLRFCCFFPGSKLLCFLRVSGRRRKGTRR